MLIKDEGDIKRGKDDKGSFLQFRKKTEEYNVSGDKQYFMPGRGYKSTYNKAFYRALRDKAMILSKILNISYKLRTHRIPQNFKITPLTEPVSFD